MKRDLADRVARFLDRTITPAQLRLLQVYGEWLENEAIPAGGLSPGERGRIDSRHVADSLLFASALPRSPDWVRDLGSGVGLPGIPLAILMPETRFELVDRSGRRADLAKRAVRILGLENVDVIQTELERLTPPGDVLVSRAVMSPEDMMKWANHLLTPGGVAILGGSWVKRPVFTGWTSIEIPAMVLDQPVWLLMMRRQ